MIVIMVKYLRLTKTVCRKRDAGQETDHKKDDCSTPLKLLTMVWA